MGPGLDRPPDRTPGRRRSCPRCAWQASGAESRTVRHRASGSEPRVRPAEVRVRGPSWTFATPGSLVEQLRPRRPARLRPASSTAITVEPVRKRLGAGPVSAAATRRAPRTGPSMLTLKAVTKLPEKSSTNGPLLMNAPCSPVLAWLTGPNVQCSRRLSAGCRRDRRPGRSGPLTSRVTFAPWTHW